MVSLCLYSPIPFRRTLHGVRFDAYRTEGILYDCTLHNSNCEALLCIEPPSFQFLPYFPVPAKLPSLHWNFLLGCPFRAPDSPTTAATTPRDFITYTMGSK